MKGRAWGHTSVTRWMVRGGAQTGGIAFIHILISASPIPSLGLEGPEIALTLGLTVWEEAASKTMLTLRWWHRGWCSSLVKVEWGGRLAAESTLFLKWAGRGRQGSHLKIPTEAWHCGQGWGRASARPPDPGMRGEQHTVHCLRSVGPAILEGSLPLP